MGFLHPEALDGVGGDVPDAVTVGDTTYDVGDDGVVDCGESVARRMAASHGVDVDRLSPNGEAPQTDAEESDGDVCGTEMSDGSVCERPADDCPYH